MGLFLFRVNLKTICPVSFFYKNDHLRLNHHRDYKLNTLRVKRQRWDEGVFI